MLLLFTRRAAVNARRSDLIQAIRGPIMLITFGLLVVLQYFGGISFLGRTWPVLLIVFGLLKLLERPGSSAAPPPPTGGVRV